MTSPGAVARYVTAQLPLEQVEQLALRTRPVRALVAGPVSYWVTRRGAAGVIGVSDRQVAYLTDADRLPYVVHSNGWRLYRRAQVEVIGNARRERYAPDGRPRLTVDRTVNA